MASPRASIPRSPCRASAGCRKKDGVPVLERVAEILRPIRPDLPIPVTAIRPLQAKRTSTAFTKVLSRRAFTSCRARASMSSTLRAVSRLTAISSSRYALLDRGAAVLRSYGVLGCAEAHPYNVLLGAMNLMFQDSFSSDGLGTTILLGGPASRLIAKAVTRLRRRRGLRLDCHGFLGRCRLRRRLLLRGLVA